MAKSLNLWTFVVGGIVGGAIAYMARGELEKILPKLGVANRATTQGYYASGVYRR